MKVAVIGGKLQGIEITYLAKEAGYEVILVDHKESPPAKQMAHQFNCLDVWDEEDMLEIFSCVDVVFPAIEDELVLNKLEEYQKQTGTRLIYDKNAYGISQSKKKSKELFHELEIPMASNYPTCSYPVIIKPDNQSGSQGVYKVWSKQEVESLIEKVGKPCVIEEFLEGRSFSIEVIGDGKHFTTSLITEVVMGDGYDCKRIIAPASVTEKEKIQLMDMAEKLAKQLLLYGIFDIEVISHNGKLNILEIDARFPSQTPIAIYYATGMNLVERLVMEDFSEPNQVQRVALYQQIKVNTEEILVLGEHILGMCNDMYSIRGFFGAEDAITDYGDEKEEWYAILITIGENYKQAYEAFLTCINKIQKQIGRRRLVETQ